MQVKNISARGWYVGDKLVAPLETVELSDDFYNDVKDNADLEVSKGEKKLTKKEQAALDKAIADAQKTLADAIESGDEEAVKAAELVLSELLPE